MGAIHNLLKRCGFIKLDHYGLVLTPDDRVISNRPVLDDGFGSRVVGWRQDDFAAMQLTQWGEARPAAPIAPSKPMPRPAAVVALPPRPVVAAPPQVFAAPPPQVFAAPPPQVFAAPPPQVFAAPPPAVQLAPEPEQEDDDWEWVIAVARAKAVAEASVHEAVTVRSLPAVKASDIAAMKPSTTVIPVPAMPSRPAQKFAPVVRTSPGQTPGSRRFARGTGEDTIRTRSAPPAPWGPANDDETVPGVSLPVAARR